MSAHDVAEAVAILDGAGVLDRLKREAQDERETERNALLAELVQAEQRDQAAGAAAAEGSEKLTAKIEKLEAQLLAAREELNLLTAGGAAGIHAANIRGRLRKLADPRIQSAIADVSRFWNMARHRFASRQVPKPAGVFFRGKTAVTESNAATIAEIMAACVAAREQLEAMQEAPRPDDLDGVIEHLVGPVRADLRTLSGL
ncbi:MAG: hypothetical protein Q8M09_20625 [Pseudomonadota bacterium]|nr:hypothetical protein [Pseudomonadota bacterium]MDP2351681.1 hypothetical protein [Pseudomonadota bacterium]